MIQRDDRRGFGQSVALHHQKPEPAPKLFELGIERRGAHHGAPELPAESAMDRAIAPPALQPMLLRSGIRFRRRRERAADVFAQDVEDLRHRHQHRDPRAT